MNEMILTATIFSATTNRCSEITYLARTEKRSVIILNDSSNQTCDNFVLFPVVAEYITFDNGNELVSKFEGSSFISLSKPTGSLTLGTSNLNYGTPTIMEVLNKDGLSVPESDPEYPVVLPILYDM